MQDGAGVEVSSIDSEAARHKARRNAASGQAEAAGKALQFFTGPIGLIHTPPAAKDICKLSLAPLCEGSATSLASATQRG